MSADPRAELHAIYATLPPTARRVRVECMTDTQVADALHRWRLRVQRAAEARVAVGRGGKRRL